MSDTLMHTYFACFFAFWRVLARPLRLAAVACAPTPMDALYHVLALQTLYKSPYTGDVFNDFSARSRLRYPCLKYDGFNSHPTNILPVLTAT